MNKKRLTDLLSCALALILVGCTVGRTPTLPAQTPAATRTATAQPTEVVIDTQPPAAVPTITPEAAAEPTPAEVAAPARQAFAKYALAPVNVQPSLEQYPIDPGMENVLVPLVLSAEQLEQLAGPGVVASPAGYGEFYELYNEAVRNNLPVFVTSDALLHAYHLIFDQLLSSLEEQVFLPRMKVLNQALLVQAKKQLDALQGTSWEDAARRTVAFLAVGARLADPNYTLPETVSSLAQSELDLIEAAAGPAPSPVFTHLKYGEDYSQYTPRGHYTKSDSLKAYFKAMMWYGRMTFRLNDTEDPAAGPDETRMALLLALAVRDGKAGNEPALDIWRLLYDPTAFLVGRSDDLTLEDYFPLMEQVYGPGAPLTEVADDARLDAFIGAADKLPAPRILGLLSDDYKPVEAVKGLRLMGQRFVVDAYIFQELIHPKVPHRYLPSGLDVMAVMGSERAALWLAQDPTTQIPQYAAQFQSLTGWMGGLTQEDWTETSYSGWLYALRPLLEPAPAGSPLFMQSDAWRDKQLNTALGSWAELKHDTILYAKQAYGGIGGCGWPMPPEPLQAQNYVEPVPEVFARIAALADMTRAGLEERGLIQSLREDEPFMPTFNDRLEALSAQALAFKKMAEKELQGQALSGQEQATLRTFGEYLEELVQWINGQESDPDPAAIIADVATDPNNGEVLEVGIGSVHEVYAVAPIPQADGSLVYTVARGGIFSYYEFPSQERLTDEAWRERVKNGEAPEQPAFTSGFSVAEPSRPDIQAAIYRFQRDWANWMYLTSGYNGEMGCPAVPEFHVQVAPGVLAKAQAAASEMKAQHMYEGRQWINTDYLSVEPSASSPGNVIVNVRETWRDFLVTYQGEDAFAWYEQGLTEPVSNQRGPYYLTALYELEPVQSECAVTVPPSQCLAWKIVRFEELSPRPGWQEP